MAKLKLIADPEFTGKVQIPLADGSSVDVRMTFKHRTRVDLTDFVIKMRESKPDEKDMTPEKALDRDVDTFMEMVKGWDLEDDFTKENVRLLLDNYMGAAIATYDCYMRSLQRANVGN